MKFFYEVLKEFLKRNGYDKAAGWVDKSISTVYRWVEPESGIDMPAKYISLLTNLTKDYALIESEAAKCGGYFVRLNIDGQFDKHSMLLKLSSLTQNFADLLKTSSKAIEDGKIDDKETKEILHDVNQLITALGQLKFDLESKK
jgi:hypothetical protein